jgi:hypothetical protein
MGRVWANAAEPVAPTIKTTKSQFGKEAYLLEFILLWPNNSPIASA